MNTFFKRDPSENHQNTEEKPTQNGSDATYTPTKNFIMSLSILILAVLAVGVVVFAVWQLVSDEEEATTQTVLETTETATTSNDQQAKEAEVAITTETVKEEVPVIQNPDNIVDTGVMNDLENYALIGATLLITVLAISLRRLNLALVTRN